MFQVQKLWSPEEDTIMDTLVQIYGTQWVKISKYLPNRTSDMIRNRYLRRTKFVKETAKNKCSVCGIVKKGHTCQDKLKNFLSSNVKKMLDASLLLSIQSTPNAEKTIESSLLSIQSISSTKCVIPTVLGEEFQAPLSHQTTDKIPCVNPRILDRRKRWTEKISNGCILTISKLNTLGVKAMEEYLKAMGNGLKTGKYSKEYLSKKLLCELQKYEGCVWSKCMNNN